MNPQLIQNESGKSLRLIRPSIVILCGPSACGKSTFAKTHFRPTQIVSSDYARALVCDDERDQRFNAQAFDLVHYLVETRLTLNRLCVVDSTALTAQARKDLVNLARKCQVQTTLIIFTVPLAICIERDAKREKPVGQAVIERRYENFEASRDSIREEGFDQIVEFNGSEQDDVRIDILFRPVQRPPRVEASPSSRFERPGQRLIRRPNGNGARDSVPIRSVVSTVTPSVESQVITTPAIIAPQPTGSKPADSAMPVTVASAAPSVEPSATAPGINKKNFGAGSAS